VVQYPRLAETYQNDNEDDEKKGRTSAGLQFPERIGSMSKYNLIFSLKKESPPRPQVLRPSWLRNQEWRQFHMSGDSSVDADRANNLLDFFEVRRFFTVRVRNQGVDTLRLAVGDPAHNPQLGMVCE